MRNKIDHKDIKTFVKAWYNAESPINFDDAKRIRYGFVDDLNNHHTIPYNHLRGEDADFCLSDEIRFFFELPTKEIFKEHHEDINNFVKAWYKSSNRKVKNVPEELKIGFIDYRNFHHTITISSMREHGLNAMSKDMFNFFLDAAKEEAKVEEAKKT
jgi:hypothetical protein